MEFRPSALEQDAAPPAGEPCLVEETRHRAGCMVCGVPLVYDEKPREHMCHYCMQVVPGDAACEAGHHVCDSCHVDDSLAVMEHICLTTTETDMIALLSHIRSHRSVSVHGPEHHAMVPAIILSTYRNLGGEVSDEMIRKVIRRGAKVAGGSCGLMGVCGAASGTGIAFASLLGATPKKAALRQLVMDFTIKVLSEVASMRAARCCQRDCYLALRKAAELSPEYLDVTLLAEEPYPCKQMHLNKECAEGDCPLWHEE